jgi:hypothetical protein
VHATPAVRAALEARKPAAATTGSGSAGSISGSRSSNSSGSVDSQLLLKLQLQLHEKQIAQGLLKEVQTLLMQVCSMSTHSGCSSSTISYCKLLLLLHTQSSYIIVASNSRHTTSEQLHRGVLQMPCCAASVRRIIDCE